MRIAIAGLLLTALLSLGGAGYWYVKRLEARVEDLNRKNGVLSVQVQQEKMNTDIALRAVEETKDVLITFVKKVQEMSENDKNAALEGERINEIFSNHDIGVLAKDRPGLIENRVNSGSDRIRLMFECASRVADENCDKIGRDPQDSATP